MDSDKRKISYLLALSGRAQVYNLIGQNQLAINDVQHGLDQLKKTSDDRLQIKFLLILANIYNSFSRFNSMLRCSRQALKLSKRNKYRKDEAHALRMIGIVYYYLHDNFKAMEYYRKSGEIYKRIKDQSGQGSILGNLGTVHLQLLDFLKALEYIKRALNINTKTGDLKQQAGNNHNLGLVYRELKDYDNAFLSFARALKIYETIGDIRNAAQCLANIGAAHLIQGNMTKAISYFQKGYEFRYQVGDLRSQAHSVYTIGISFYRMGMYKEAEINLKRSIDLYLKAGDQRYMGYSLVDLIRCIIEHRKRPAVMQYLIKAEKIGRQFKDRQILAATLIMRAEIELGKHRLDKVRKILSQAYKSVARTQINYPNIVLLEARLLSEKRIKLSLNKKFEKAIALFAQNQENFHQHLAKFYYALHLIKIGDLTSASSMLNEALVFFEKINNDSYAHKIKSILERINR